MIGGGALPPTSGVQLRSAGGTQVIVRPSGTEPKVKAYIEVIETVRGVDDLERARGEAERRLAHVRDEVEALLRG